MYFNSEAEKQAYFGNEPIPCKILAIVKDGGNEVLYTTSNNQSATGTASSQGGYIPSPEDEEKVDSYDEALTLSEYTLEGEDEEENNE